MELLWEGIVNDVWKESKRAWLGAGKGEGLEISHHFMAIHVNSVLCRLYECMNRCTMP